MMEMPRGARNSDPRSVSRARDDRPDRVANVLIMTAFFLMMPISQKISTNPMIETPGRIA